MRPLAVAITISLLVGASSPARGGCADALGIVAARRYISEYLSEFRTPEGRFKWSRFVLAPVKTGETSPDTKWLGFLTADPAIPRWSWYRVFTLPVWIPYGILQAVPYTLSGWVLGKRYALTPLDATVGLIGSPIRYLTRKLVGQSYSISRLISAPAGILTVSFLMGIGEQSVSEVEKMVVVSNVEEHGPEWDEKIQSDYRYVHIREARDRKELSAGAARTEAFLWAKVLRKYYGRSDVLENDAAEEVLKLPHFGRLLEWSKRGVPRTAGYLYGAEFTPRVTEAQVKQLIQLNHLRYVQLELIYQRVTSPDSVATLRKEGRLAQLLDDLETDPYANFLFSAYSKAKITKAQLLFRLQEDNHRKVMFAEDRLLKRTLVDEEGRPLGLEDFRQAAIEEMKRQAPTSPAAP